MSRLGVRDGNTEERSITPSNQTTAAGGLKRVGPGAGIDLHAGLI